eukprot:134754_1
MSIVVRPDYQVPLIKQMVNSVTMQSYGQLIICVANNHPKTQQIASQFAHILNHRVDNAEVSKSKHQLRNNESIVISLARLKVQTVVALFGLNSRVTRRCLIVIEHNALQKQQLIRNATNMNKIEQKVSPIRVIHLICYSDPLSSVLYLHRRLFTAKNALSFTADIKSTPNSFITARNALNKAYQQHTDSIKDVMDTLFTDSIKDALKKIKHHDQQQTESIEEAIVSKTPVSTCAFPLGQFLQVIAKVLPTKDRVLADKCSTMLRQYVQIRTKSNHFTETELDCVIENALLTLLHLNLYLNAQTYSTVFTILNIISITYPEYELSIDGAKYLEEVVWIVFYLGDHHRVRDAIRCSILFGVQPEFDKDIFSESYVLIGSTFCNRPLYSERKIKLLIGSNIRNTPLKYTITFDEEQITFSMVPYIIEALIKTYLCGDTKHISTDIINASRFIRLSSSVDVRLYLRFIANMHIKDKDRAWRIFGPNWFRIIDITLEHVHNGTLQFGNVCTSLMSVLQMFEICYVLNMDDNDWLSTWYNNIRRRLNQAVTEWIGLND